MFKYLETLCTLQKPSPQKKAVVKKRKVKLRKKGKHPSFPPPRPAPPRPIPPPPPRPALPHLTARRACTTFSFSASRTQDDSELEKLSDVTDLLRIVLGIVLGLCAIIGPLLVLVAHVLPVQKSPVIHDDSCEELAPAVA